MRAGLLVALALSTTSTSGFAKFENPWVNFGVMLDGSLHSWNKQTVEKSGDVFIVRTRLSYPSPQQIPGKEPGVVSKTVFTTYRIACWMNLVQAMSVSHRDTSGKEIAASNVAQMQKRANPRGDAIRDRLLVAVCTELDPEWQSNDQAQ